MRRSVALSAVVLLLGVPAAAGLAPDTATPNVDRYVVETDELTDAELERAAQAAGGSVVRVDEALGFAVVRIEDPAAFAGSAGVEPRLDARGGGATDAAVARVPDDEYYPAQWGPTELDAPQTWKINPGVDDITVGVVDSGIDGDHPDLQAVGMTLGFDYVEGDTVPSDEHGHGTHVAGIIAATRDNGAGIAGMTTPDLYVTRVFDENNAGWCADFASGIREAADAGVDVINFSGFCSVENVQLGDAISYATNEKGIPVFVSAGNSQLYNPDACVQFPARHPAAIAVAATNAATGPAVYSCQGAELELAAPGSDILSTWLDGGYAFASGTSMAAPHAAATAAMVLDQSPGLTTEALRDRLNETARDLGPPGHDTYYGNGMIDPVNALTGSPVFVPSMG